MDFPKKCLFLLVVKHDVQLVALMVVKMFISVKQLILICNILSPVVYFLPILTIFSPLQCPDRVQVCPCYQSAT